MHVTSLFYFSVGTFQPATKDTLVRVLLNDESPLEKCVGSTSFLPKTIKI